MNIDELEAGPELDARIAEKVMGWKWNIVGGVCYADRFTENAPDCWIEFKPSIAIADAWDVVEKFRFKTVGEYPATFNPIGWSCYLSNMPNRDFIATAPTAQLAICRAALKAKNA